MTRRTRHPTGKTEQLLPRDLRTALEQARLRLRALLRAIDQLGIAQDLPASLRDLMSLDADYAEALWVLDQPARGFDVQAIARDSLQSLSLLPSVCEVFLASLPAPDRASLLRRADLVARQLAPGDAYLQVPGRDPHA